jgi:hypothetical protein
MKRILLHSVLCNVAFAIFLFKAGAQEPKPTSAGGLDISALDEQNRGRWEAHSGKWKFEDGELVGSGDSAIDFKGPFEPPFTLSFRIKVISGQRPRVKVGTVTLANEGEKRTFQVVAHNQAFGYKLNQEYQIAMEVESDSVVVLIDGIKELNTEQLVGPVSAITFRSGDYWSKGTSRFSDIVIHQSKLPDALPVAGQPLPAPAPENLVKILSEQAPNALEWALAPLNRTAPRDIRENLTLLREDLLDEGAKKPMGSAETYKLGAELCNELIGTFDERDKMLVRAGYTAVQARVNMGEITNQALEARRRFTNWPTYQREKDQRGEVRKEKANAADLEKQRPVLEWANRGEQIRRMVDVLYAQFRDAVRQPAAAR